MKNATLLHDFENSLDSLVGLRCKETVASPITGSIFSMYFGGEGLVSLDELVSLNEDDQVNDTEQNRLSLYVACVWRIDSEEGVICGAWSDNEQERIMQKGLKFLEEKEILAVFLTKPALDLTLHFSDGYTLRIFCDVVDTRKPQRNNYSFFLPGHYYRLVVMFRINNLT